MKGDRRVGVGVRGRDEQASPLQTEAGARSQGTQPCDSSITAQGDPFQAPGLQHRETKFEAGESAAIC